MEQMSTSELIRRLRGNLPEEIKQRDRSLLWRLEDKGTGKKPAKVPYSASGGRGKTNDPSTWASFEGVIAAWEATPDSYSGIGWVLGDDIMGIDMDNVIWYGNEGNRHIDDYYIDIIEKLHPCYVEVSPSGTGLHILLRAALPADRSQIKFKNIEFYDETSPRFLTLTGNVFWEGYDAINEDDASKVLAEVYYQVLNDHKAASKTTKGEVKAPSSKAAKSRFKVSAMNDMVLLEKAQRAVNREKFEALYTRGDYISLDYTSASEGTAALLNMLAFWTSKDKEQIDRLFRSSAMYQHESEKWDRPQSGSTWGALEIDKACALCESTYSHGGIRFPDTKKERILGTTDNLRVLLDSSGMSVSYDEIKKDFAFDLESEDKDQYSRDNSNNAFWGRLVSLANKHDFPTTHMSALLLEIADKDRCNPVRDWILSKPWDGEDRLSTLCGTITVSSDYSTEFRDVLITKWLLSAVAAACHDPWDGRFSARGCLVLQGQQGIGKTRWFRSLAPQEWVKDGISLDPSDKDSVRIAVSHWICELGELDSTLRRDIGRLKAFLTLEEDQIRLPYDRNVSKFTRRTIFGASVNMPDFLRDDTGNSRFWTIPVVAIDYEHGVDMQQVFAQLYCSWQSDGQWWLSSEEESMLATCNKMFEEKDEIYDLLVTKIDWSRFEEDYENGSYERLSPTEVLQNRLGIEHPQKTQQNRCAKHLRKLTGLSDALGNGHKRWYPIPSRQPVSLDQAVAMVNMAQEVGTRIRQEQQRKNTEKEA